MRSGILYFNKTLYTKTMKRFWPLWALYGLFWMFALPLTCFTLYSDRYSSGNVTERIVDWGCNLPSLLPVGNVLAAAFGLFSAMAVFGYLYSSRSSCMMHALPMRREALFLTQYAVGLSFLLLPQLAMAALTAVELVCMVPSQCALVLPALGMWLVCQCGLALFYYSFAVFCAMFTGHILALPVFYGILNGLVMGVYTLLTTLFRSFFYGYTGSEFTGRIVTWFTPLYKLDTACSWNYYYWDDSRFHLLSCLNEPEVVAAYAVVGVLLTLAALWVYRTRHAESAGDVVSIPLVRPIFKYGVSFCSGLAFGMFTSVFFGMSGNAYSLTFWIILWAVVGYFVAEMFLRKSFRVFRAWKGSAAMAGAMLLLCAACFLDLFGITAQMPRLEEVESLYVNTRMGYPNDTRIRMELTDKEDIQAFLDLHRAVVNWWTEKGGGLDSGWFGSDWDESLYLTLEYRLENGSTLSREYYSIPLRQSELEQEGSITWYANQVLQRRKLFLDLERYEGGRLTEVQLDDLYDRENDERYAMLYLDMVTGVQLEELWQAVRQDFDEGNIGQRYLFNDLTCAENTYTTRLIFEWDMPHTGQNTSYTTSVAITLTPHAWHTLDWLKSHDVLGERYQISHANLGEDGVEF
ncbi:MAG: hypothetical protein HFF50_07400 [Lawsonibacter sp.]|nr:hypothetical protein [Lawsonibacter sp.]